ncbi:MAG: DUF2585 family protein [Phycisphaerae bacterium]
MTAPQMVETAVTVKPRFPLWGWLLIAAGLVVVAAGLELGMGRTLISKSGKILWWVGDVNSAEMSQQLADWYSFSHILHGVLFYGAIRLVGRGRWPVGMCLALAVGLEAAWEVLENSSFIIHRYREATIALGYEGDSVLNSMSDIGFCILGFLLARGLPVWVTILLVVVTELGLAYVIRDNLTLNIIMLIHPLEFIKHWQMGLGVVLLR